MDMVGIAKMATNMKTMNLRNEATLKVLKIAMDTAEQEGEGLMKMIDAMLTGVGRNFDMSA